MASSQVIQKRSAMPENMRMATLNQEMVRRMTNTSDMVEMDMRIKIIDTYSQNYVTQVMKRLKSNEL